MEMDDRMIGVRAFSLCALMASSALCGTSAWAQDAVPPAAPAVQSAPSGLQDIVVTAQRREERLQDVPIAVTAVGAGQIAAQAIRTSQDIQMLVPTLVYDNIAQYATPFMRGIGTDLVIPSADLSVATYLDGVYIPNAGDAISTLLAVDRVEVLEGPQGTLYGRNAVGGAINIITLSPRQELEAKASLGYGNYDRIEGSASISGGLAPGLSVGAYFMGSRRDTYLHIRHPAPVTGEPDHETNWAGRLKLVYEPSDLLRLTASYQHSDFKGREGPAYHQSDPNALGYALGATFDPDRYSVTTNAPIYQRSRADSAMFRAEVFTDSFNIVSTTGYREFRGETSNDIDSTSVYIVTVNSVIPSKSFTQEIQIQSPQGSPWTWVVGGYYYHERAAYQPLAAQFGPPLGSPVDYQETRASSKTDSFAIFGQATVPLDAVTDGLNLTLGGRYTIDRKTFQGTDQFFLGNFPDGAPAGPPTIYPSDHKRWKQFTPKITLDYKTGDTLIYGTYSKGFKSGVFNLSTPTTPGPVDPEELEAYEIGFKSDFADHRIRLNAAAYYYDFTGLQVAVTTGLTATVQNAATVRTYGLTGSLAVQASQELLFSANAAWAAGEYRDFDNYAFDGATVDASGNRIQRLPKWLIGATASFNRELDFGKLHATAGWRYNSGYYFDAAEFERQKAFHLINATIGISILDDKLDLSVWGRNLGNIYRRTSSLPTGMSRINNVAEPRMYGVTATFTY